MGRELERETHIWFDTSPWSFLVSFSPMADFINRESEGRTLRASRPSWVSSTSLPMGTVRAQETTRDALDGRVDLLVVQLAVDEDLALGDVARQVGDRVRDVCERALTAGQSRRRRERDMGVERGRATDRRWAW